MLSCCCASSAARDASKNGSHRSSKASFSFRTCCISEEWKAVCFVASGSFVSARESEVNRLSPVEVSLGSSIFGCFWSVKGWAVG